MIKLDRVKENFEKNEGYWIDYPEDEDVKFKIRPLFPDKFSELERRATKRKRNGVNEIDQEKLAILMLDFILVDWKGIEFDNGESECNIDAKKMLRKYCGNITDFIIGESGRIAEAIVSNNEETLKN